MAAPLALAVALAGAYLFAVRRVGPQAKDRAGGSRWPARRTISFLAGIALLAAALGSGLALSAEELLSAHVVEHLLVTMVAAPLLVAGAPVALALRALRGAPHARLAQAVRSPLARRITHPAVTWTAFAVVNLGIHVPTVYEAALGSASLHAAEHVVLLVTAIGFWLPLVGTNPVRHRLSSLAAVAYLLLAMLPMALTGVTLASSTSVLYPSHLAAARELGVSALADQGSAGAVMWLAGSLILVAAVVGLGMRALMREERRAVARERYADDARAAPAPGVPRASAGLPRGGR